MASHAAAIPLTSTRCCSSLACEALLPCDCAWYIMHPLVLLSRRVTEFISICCCSKHAHVVIAMHCARFGCPSIFQLVLHHSQQAQQQAVVCVSMLWYIRCVQFCRGCLLCTDDQTCLSVAGRYPIRYGTPHASLAAPSLRRAPLHYLQTLSCFCCQATGWPRLAVVFVLPNHDVGDHRIPVCITWY